LRGEFPRIQYFLGEMQPVQGEGSPRKFSDLDAWLQAILKEWEKIAWSILSIEAGHRAARITFWHREESAQLQIDAPSPEEAESLMNRLNSQMKVEFIDYNPYENPSSTCAFAIKIWQGWAFAEAVRETVPVALGQKHWVVEAWTKEEGEQSQPLRYDKTLEKYIESLQAEKPYDETSLHLQGPHGRALRIYVSEHRTRLELRSTLPQKELDEVARSFKSRLKLKPLKVSKLEDSGGDSAEKPKHWFWKILPVVGTALVTLVFTTAFLTELVPKYHVTILSPHGGKEDSKEISVPEFRVEWQVQKEFWFQKRDQEGYHADIRLLKDSFVTNYLNQATGDLVQKVSPGAYTLIVSIPQLHASDTVYFTVKGTNSP
jgi:hypothetical protein